jgi:hypothetical protein
MTIRGKVALWLVVVLGLLAPARAGTITNLSASGPGGALTAFGLNGAEALVALTYTSINYIDVTLNVSAGGAYELYEGGGVPSVANNTGTTWTGFTFSLFSAPPGTQFTGADPDDSGRFNTVVPTPNLVTYTNGSVPPGSFFKPTVAFTTPTGGMVTIRETPTPEPATILSVALAGLVGMGCLWRRRAAA